MDKRLLGAQMAGILLVSLLMGLLSRHFSSSPLPLFEEFSAARNAGIAELSIEAAVYEHKHGAVFLDARERVAYEYAHIPRAISMPADEPLRTDVVKILEGVPLVVIYCDGPSCDSALKIAQRLADEGIPQVKVMTEGWQAWTAAGLPTEKTEKK